MKKKEGVYEIDLLQLAKVLWKRAWLIFAVMILFGGAALSYAMVLVTPMYEASALMYVNNRSQGQGDQGMINSADLAAAQSLTETYAVILNSQATLQKVIEFAALRYSAEELDKMVEASAVNETEILQITVTSASPQEARDIANAFAKVLPEQIEQIVDGSSTRVVDYADAPKKQAFPSYTKYLLIGLMMGFVVSAGAVLLMEFFDEKIHGEDYLLQNYESIPLLAVIPDLDDEKQTEKSGYYGG